MKCFAPVVVQLAVLFLAREAASTSPALIAPTTAPTNYSLTIRMPEGCEPGYDDCNIFAGVNVNEGDSNYLDIYLEGLADGFVAVGFTDSPNMFDADVVHCVRDPTNDMVGARDSWNVASPDRNNTIDPTQDITVFNTSYIAGAQGATGRIECSVSKAIIGSDVGLDINLNTPLFVIFARLPTNVSDFPYLQNHGPSNRGRTAERVALPGTPVAPVTQPTNYDITARVPADCEPADCDLFVGVNLNQNSNDYIDIYLEGEADGYVAVGFSNTANMFSADVVHCVRNPDDNMVVARDSWNAASPARSNTIDTTQDITTFSTTYSSGRIQCSVAKRIMASDGQDLDLNTPLWMIYARLPGNVTNFPNLQNHGGANRFVSGARVMLPPIAATDPPPTDAPTTMATEGAQSLHSLPVVVMVVAALLAVAYY